MLKKPAVQTAAILFAFVAFGGIAHAQKGTRIKFKRGASSASVSGRSRWQPNLMCCASKNTLFGSL